MNLVTEPWIPVTKPDGTQRLASLLEVFTPTCQFADLAVRPHERIALMRLLICIAQAALDGPEDISAWDKAPEQLPGVVKRYLEGWIDHFELFYDPSEENKKFPFLQIDKLEKPPEPENKKEKTKKRKVGASIEQNSELAEQEETYVSIGKLDFALASGANTTLFDHLGDRDVKRFFSAQQIPLMLITFQNFSPGGTIGGGLWNKKPTSGWKEYSNTIKPGHSNHAPCLPKNMLHAFIRQSTVFGTICANLLTKKAISRHFNKPIDECWGKPIWEDFPTDPSKEASTRTYLGRLVPISRGIRLFPHGTEMLLANGLEYPTYGSKKTPFWREVTSTERHNKDKTERILLSAATDKAIWRELSALIIFREGDDVGGALSLRNLKDDEDCDLWVGALIADKASILDTVESVLHVPANMRTDIGCTTYNEEVRLAEKLEGLLKSAIREYRKQFDGEFSKIDDPDLPKKKKAKLEQRIKSIALSVATRHYWTAVEKLRPLLMAHIACIGTTAEAVMQTQKIWKTAVRKAAHESYRLACGQETPRQMRAFALGWAKLVSKPKDQSADQNADTETPETEETEA